MTTVTMVMKLRTVKAYRLGAVTTIPGNDTPIVGLMSELPIEALLLRTNRWPSNNGCGIGIQLVG